MARALAAAAEAGDVPTMRFLMANGANPNGTGDDHDFSPPLVSAVRSGKAAAVNELLKYHPAVNAKGAGEDAITTLLTKTLDQSEDVQILQALIAAGANVNVRDDLYGQTPVFKASDPPNAVDLLRLLVKAGADVNARDESGCTALSTCFDIDYARELIHLGADVFPRDNQGKTAAQTARDMGNNELADLLEGAMASKQKAIRRVLGICYSLIHPAALSPAQTKPRHSGINAAPAPTIKSAPTANRLLPASPLLLRGADKSMA